VFRTEKQNQDQELDRKHCVVAEESCFYDITSSYFEGGKCILATYGYSRDHRSDRKQIVIALVITPDGYPFYWRVLPGNTQDVTTIAELAKELKERFGVKECPLVFFKDCVSIVIDDRMI
jgi:transposase